MSRLTDLCIPPVGRKAFWCGPTLVLAVVLLLAVLALTPFAFRQPAVLLALTVMYGAALGGWRSGLLSALVVGLYIA